jgi:hypothetical protein
MRLSCTDPTTKLCNINTFSAVTQLYRIVSNIQLIFMNANKTKRHVCSPTNVSDDALYKFIFFVRPFYS